MKLVGDKFQSHLGEVLNITNISYADWRKVAHSRGGE